MNTFLWLLASTAAGWVLGTRTSKQQIDRRFQELEEKLAQNGAKAPVAPPPTEPVKAPEPVVVAKAPEPVAAADSGEIPEEVLLVLSAAVAAFFGKRARIRRVRRMPASGFNPWSQQGRVYIQGSHNVRLG